MIKLLFILKLQVLVFKINAKIILQQIPNLNFTFE